MFLQRQKKDLSHLVYNDGHDNNDDTFNNTNDDELFTVSEKAFDTKKFLKHLVLYFITISLKFKNKVTTSVRMFDNNK